MKLSRLLWGITIAIGLAVLSALLAKEYGQGRRDERFRLEALCAELGHQFWESELKAEWNAPESVLSINTNYYGPRGRCYVRIADEVDSGGGRIEAHDAVYEVFDLHPLAYQTSHINLGGKSSPPKYELFERNPELSTENKPRNELYSRKYLSLIELPGLENETKPY